VQQKAKQSELNFDILSCTFTYVFLQLYQRNFDLNQKIFSVKSQLVLPKINVTLLFWRPIIHAENFIN